MAGIYLHIPFCKQACSYCNFHFSTLLRYIPDYVQALLREIELQAAYLNADPLIESVYWGGGTPSLLPTDDLHRIFEQLHRYFRIAPTAEITLEANPDDLHTGYLKSLQQTPVNRLSIGVQSFFDEDLKLMRRAHDARLALYCIKNAQDRGFENLSIDLIYATPTLTSERWQQNLRQTFALQVPHFSAYSLTIEPKTLLHHQQKKGFFQESSPETAATHMQQLMHEAAANGYEHYEISNFAAKGNYARHNSSYWQQKHYLGLGAAAHSYNGNTRQWNIANNASYIKAVLQENRVPCEGEVLSATQRYNEYLLTGLRTKWGVKPTYIAAEFGAERLRYFEEQAAELLAKKWAYYDAEQQCYRLTQNGILIADRLTADLFIDDEL